MSKIILKYLVVVSLWLMDIALAFWLFVISRTALLDIFALFYKPGAWVYSRRVDFADKVFLIIFGLGWLVFMIFVEAYFQAGVFGEDLFHRFARVTGPVLVGVFCVDLLLVWLQDVGAGGWFRWLLLAAELGAGIFLIQSGRTRPEFKLI